MPNQDNDDANSEGNPQHKAQQNKRGKAGRKPLADPNQLKNQRAIALLTGDEIKRLGQVIGFLGKSQSDYIRNLLLADIERVENEMTRQHLEASRDQDGNNQRLL